MNLKEGGFSTHDAGPATVSHREDPVIKLCRSETVHVDAS
jgi:hypothetical protein